MRTFDKMRMSEKCNFLSGHDSSSNSSSNSQMDLCNYNSFNSINPL